MVGLQKSTKTSNILAGRSNCDNKYKKSPDGAIVDSKENRRSMDASLLQDQDHNVNSIASMPKRHSLLSPVGDHGELFESTIVASTIKAEKVKDSVHCGHGANTLILKETRPDKNADKKNCKSAAVSSRISEKLTPTETVNAKVIPVEVNVRQKEQIPIGKYYSEKGVGASDTKISDMPKKINEKKNKTTNLLDTNLNRDRTESCCSSYGSLFSGSPENDAAIIVSQLDRIPSPVRKFFEVKSKVCFMLIKSSFCDFK